MIALTVDALDRTSVSLCHFIYRDRHVIGHSLDAGLLVKKPPNHASFQFWKFEDLISERDMERFNVLTFIFQCQPERFGESVSVFLENPFAKNENLAVATILKSSVDEECASTTFRAGFYFHLLILWLVFRYLLRPILTPSK